MLATPSFILHKINDLKFNPTRPIVNCGSQFVNVIHLENLHNRQLYFKTQYLKKIMLRIIQTYKSSQLIIKCHFPQEINKYFGQMNTEKHITVSLWLMRLITYDFDKLMQKITDNNKSI